MPSQAVVRYRSASPGPAEGRAGRLGHRHRQARQQLPGGGVPAHLAAAPHGHPQASLGVHHQPIRHHRPGWERDQVVGLPADAAGVGVVVERPHPRLGLARVDEVEDGPVGAPAQPVRLGDPLEHGGDRSVRVEPVQRPRARPDVVGDRPGPEPAHRVARAVVEADVVGHAGWAPRAGLAAAAGVGEPETVGGREHVPARAAVGGGADRDRPPVRRQLEHHVVPLTGGVPVQPPGLDVHPGQERPARVPDRPLAKLGAGLGDHLPRWRLGRLPGRCLRGCRARAVALLAHSPIRRHAPLPVLMCTSP